MLNGDDNIVFVGNKPVSSYILAVTSQFKEGSSEVIIKARGKAISKAVDVAEIVRRRYVKNVKADVSIGTEEVAADDGRMMKVSSITIVLAHAQDEST
ncbi:MAG TPA: DNA-binding protein Alba [Methanomassiliicoccaceae archaeon]|jgi:DNA-binding protein|nr:DNA-binding protein Alba [Euryarchaeota archaeon]HOB37689.1 DNA-binding protein Alba [Methanomassiliicoccaceae archaeon]HOK27934.1 DNA-binding protein Alba [Methanomassiliicoccaceae archaeon]HOL07070.1 DNA-binding protein Alba [Methanomassiliicoccaceae archaeon]HOQ25719.1 DNA-binding protein Alba [Methanomassiliicoccaceae archaeon]